MPINFHLGPTEAGVRAVANGFAQQVLKPVRAEYHGIQEQSKRFQATQSAYALAVQGGMLKGMISPSLGGAGGSLVEACILVEECYAVEPSTALTIFSTALGLMPINLLQKPETKQLLEPFLSGEGAPMCSLVFSEPGGVANFLEKGAPGLNTTARRDGNTWVLNGEKIWATNSAGWDFKGCDLACVVCRDVSNGELSPDDDPADSIMILLVTRANLDAQAPGAFETLRHVSTMGHTTTSGPHIRYKDVRVPLDNLLVGPGKAAIDAVLGSFDASAVQVGAMAVGLMRAAFDAALDFAKKDNRRGAVPLLEHQAVADLLSGIKMQTEACRALTWKAAFTLENGPGDYNARKELALSAKIYCSDAAVKVVTDAINVVGV